MEEDKKEIKYENVVFCGGYGDIIALDSIINKETKKNFKKIIILNRVVKSEEDYRLEFLKKNNYYNSPDVEFCSFYTKFKKEKKSEQFANFPTYYILNKIKKNFKIQRSKIIFCFKFWKKYYLSKLYEKDNIEIRKKNSYYYSENLVDINKFNLPNNYFVIVGWSRDGRPENSNLNYNEWLEIKKLLEENKIFGVLLNKNHKDKIPDCKYFINLIGQTNYLEALEISKKANGYIGINGSLSIFPMFKNPENCFIKCAYENFIKINHKKYYSNVENKKNIMLKQLNFKNLNINFNF